MSRQLHRYLFFVCTFLFLGACLQKAAIAEPLRSELRIANEINQAMLKRWNAELMLSSRRLAQIERLHEIGHASWLEMARLRVRVEQLESRRDAEVEISQFLHRLSQRRSRGRVSQTSHAFRFREPDSVRLVGWFDVDTVPPELADRILEQHGDDETRSPCASYRTQLDEAQARVRKLQDAGHHDGSEALCHAKLELELAEAQLELALAWQELEKRDSQAIRALARSRASGKSMHRVQGMTPQLRTSTASLKQQENQRAGPLHIARIQQQRATERRIAIQELYKSGHATRAELEAAQKAAQVANRAVCEEQAARDESVEADSVRPQAADIDPDQYWQIIDRHAIAHPVVLRHLTELRRDRITTAARHREHLAEQRLNEALLERLRRSQATQRSAQREQLDAELDLELTRARLLEVSERLDLLRLEEARFVMHLLPMVEGSDLVVAQRLGWALSLAGLVPPSRLLLSGALYFDGYLSRHVAYYESTSVIDPVSLCRASVCELVCRESQADLLTEWTSVFRRRPKSVTSSFPNCSHTQHFTAPSIMLSTYDLQRLCSYYCDLPGSYCPRPNLGPDRLFSSYAVPVRLFSDQPNWLGIRIDTFGNPLGRLYEPYLGFNGFAGIPVARPVPRRVPQLIRYRPSLRIP